MLGYREKLPDDGFIPSEISYSAGLLKDLGRKVQIVSRVWGGFQSNCYFGGHDHVLVDINGIWPWQRRDLIKSSIVPGAFWYRANDEDMPHLIEDVQERFPDSSFIGIEQFDKSPLAWTLQFVYT